MFRNHMLDKSPPHFIVNNHEASEIAAVGIHESHSYITVADQLTHIREISIQESHVFVKVFAIVMSPQIIQPH